MGNSAIENLQRSLGQYPRWRTYSVTDSRYQVDGDQVYGAGFGEVLARPPASVMLAEGSAVTVYQRERAGVAGQMQGAR
jgi:hypothetical protein